MTIHRTIAFVACLIVATSLIAEARRGCCSWHGGVAGCDHRAGRLVCRDGTYSPSCGCDFEPVENPAVQAPPVCMSTPENVPRDASSQEINSSTNAGSLQTTSPL